MRSDKEAPDSTGAVAWAECQEVQGVLCGVGGFPKAGKGRQGCRKEGVCLCMFGEGRGGGGGGGGGGFSRGRQGMLSFVRLRPLQGQSMNDENIKLEF